MSCWKCQTSFKEGYDYCLNCDANRQATCIICYEGVYAARVDDVHCLWDDEGWSGRPVCSECYEILKIKVPEKLDRKICRKNCLICEYLTTQTNKNNICEAKHVNMGKSVYYEPKKRGLEAWL